MKTVLAFCAVLVGVGCGPALAAPARSSVATLFNEGAPRPPGLIPHGRGQAAETPVPRPKPADAARNAPTAAAPFGPIVFPPVAPLE